MSNLIPFQFENHKIRTVVENGEVWVVVADIAKAIEYANPSDLAKLADEDDLEKFEVTDSLGRKQQAWAANESGLYQILLSATVEKAKPFRKWVTSEVLPSIRKTGSYALPNAEPPKQRPLATDTVLQLPACLDAIKAILPNLGESSLQALAGDICELDLGRRLIPLPVIEEKFYTATELGEEFGYTAIGIGRIANAHGLKTEEHGEYRLSKSKHSSKQVEQFYYNETGRQALALVCSEIAESLAKGGKIYA